MEETNPTISPETQKFVELFKKIPNVELIPWVGTEAVGLSILKDYPDEGTFIPARNARNEKDSVALIKIGYHPQKIKENKVNLLVRVFKASHYLLKKHLDYNFDDKNSPTRASLEESKASKQPMDLEEISRYEYYIDTGTFYDHEKNTNISSQDIVKNIYNSHLKTTKDLAFRTKVHFKEKVIAYIGPLNKLLEKINFYLFGKHIKKGEDFGIGIFKPYPQKDLVTLATEKTNILGINLPITANTSVTFTVFVSAIYLINHYLDYDFLGLINLIEKNNNSLFIISFATVVLLFFEKIIPRFTLLIINILIKLRLWLTNLKIRIQ